MTAKQEKSSGGETRFSILELNQQLYGVDILKSREVFPLPDITPVPNTAAFVLGVFNLRGEIFPLIDISGILQLPLKEVAPTDMVILLEGNGAVIGVLVDRILGVKTLRHDQIGNPKGIVPKKQLEFIDGVVTDKSEEIYLLNLDRMFASPLLKLT
ncbi:MAG: chemotaxis protein CheW [Calditrichia bacterium]